jgi:hypothetical protein
MGGGLPGAAIQLDTAAAGGGAWGAEYGIGGATDWRGEGEVGMRRRRMGEKIKEELRQEVWTECSEGLWERGAVGRIGSGVDLERGRVTLYLFKGDHFIGAGVGGAELTRAPASCHVSAVGGGGGRGCSLRQTYCIAHRTALHRAALLHSIQYTVYSIQYTVYSIPYTVYSTVQFLCCTTNHMAQAREVQYSTGHM